MTDKPRKTTVAGTVKPELKEQIEDYRWDNRMTVSAVIEEALTDWVAKVSKARVAKK